MVDGLAMSGNPMPAGVGVGGPMLKAGNVITVEPGLYDPAVGGVRLEDMVVVTATGCENLTTIAKRFVV